jgi:tetratricopeptide (TPR) repeat protein
MIRRYLVTWAVGLSLAAASGAAEQEVPPADVSPAKAAVLELGSLDFHQREAASRKLWKLGAEAVEELAEAAKSSDPEVSRRARVLLDGIRAGIGPDTAEEIIELVQKYGEGTPSQKIKVLERLRAQRAFVQIIRLYHFEEDETVRRTSADLVGVVVLPAISQLLAADDLDGAIALLRVCPEAPEKFRRLAALYRAAGSLEVEIADLQARNDPAEHPLLLACHLAAGDLEEGLSLARKMGQEETVAALSALSGDPVPYFEWFLHSQDLDNKVRMHVELCYERWRGREDDARSLLPPMVTEAREDGDEDGLIAQALFLNGYVAEGIKALSADPEHTAALVTYYDGVERPKEVLALFGYPEGPREREEWEGKRIAELTKSWDLYGPLADELLGVAGLLAERGKRDEAARMLAPLVAAARGADREIWDDLLAALGGRSGEFLELGFRAVSEGAGDDLMGTFSQISTLMVYWESSFEDFGTSLRFSSQLRQLWDLLGDAGIEAPGDRCLALGQLLGVVHAPPPQVRELDGKILAQGGKAARPLEVYEALCVAALLRGDSTLLPELFEKMILEPGGERWRYPLMEQYAYRHEWEKAGDAWDKVIEENGNQAKPLANSVQRLAVLMRLDRGDEVKQVLERINTRHLDEPGELARIALVLEGGGLWDEAASYWRRILVTSTPYQRTWQFAAERYLRDVKNRGDWPVAASLAQVDVVGSQMDSLRVRAYGPWFSLRKNFSLSFYRALMLLREGREEEARRLLDSAVDPVTGDGVLADDFFPILREEGHVELHDHYFELCYGRMKESLELFPDAHNTYNSLAWLASRANRRLDEAEEYSTKALEMRPRQAAYLDTMAEIWFARRDREKAIEWSLKSMRNAQHGGHTRNGGGAELRAQHDRFLTGPFPAP